MGDDFTNHQVFTAHHPSQQRSQIISLLQAYLSEQGFIEVEAQNQADRSIAIGPAGRWTCIYDSFGNGDAPNRDEFKHLAAHLSLIAPVVDIYMDDSAFFQFYVYRDGKQVDQVANSLGFFHTWVSDSERNTYRGSPKQWIDFLLDLSEAETLREAWGRGNAGIVLSKTATLVGWHPRLCEVGYTIDYDGIPVSYKDYLHDKPGPSGF